VGRILEDGCAALTACLEYLSDLAVTAKDLSGEGLFLSLHHYYLLEKNYQ